MIPFNKYKLQYIAQSNDDSDSGSNHTSGDGGVGDGVVRDNGGSYDDKDDSD